MFDVPRAGAGGSTKPITVYRSVDHPPFYLSWSPDGRRVAFLANEAAGISLRVAIADGSVPVDGPHHDGIIRTGAPLYFDWEGPDRLLLHVGVGSGAFVGEVGLSGGPVGPSISGTGDFRTAVASSDGRYVGYVRDGPAAGEIVAASRDGATLQRLQAFGPAAIAFAPATDTLASIAAAEPVANPVSFPLGPLRLLDGRTGASRTLMDGLVVGFFWSPDGRTIAALSLAPAGRSSADVPATLTADTGTRLVAVATPEPTTEIHLAFIDATTGVASTDRVVRLGDDFVTTVLPYFDQYALSHRIWAPDSSSIVLPLLASNGQSQAFVLRADGAAGVPVGDATSAFWSP